MRHGVLFWENPDPFVQLFFVRAVIPRALPPEEEALPPLPEPALQERPQEVFPPELLPRGLPAAPLPERQLPVWELHP